MITDIESWLRWFEGVNRRAMRDIGALPDAAETWTPPALEGERGWDIGDLVAHIASSRIFFAAAYAEGRWVAEPWSRPTRTRDEWLAALEESAAEVRQRLENTSPEWLHRRVDSLDSPGKTIAGWRLLMMMAEHDVHHRSQVDTYAGLAGWEVKQIFGRTAEAVGLTALTKENPEA